MNKTGSELASGASKQSYINSEDSFCFDLKTLSKEAIIDKYLTDEEGYLLYIQQLQDKEAILTPSLRKPAIKEDLPIKNKQLSQITLQNKPKVCYKLKSLKEDHIIISRVSKEHSSYLTIPDSNLSKSDLGYIVQVGSISTQDFISKEAGCVQTISLQNDFFSVGDLVLFDRFAALSGDILLLDETGLERNYVLLNKRDILAVLEKTSVN